MKLLGRKIKKQAIAIFMAALMVLGSITLLPPAEAQAGVAAKIGTKIGKWAFDKAIDIIYDETVAGISEVAGDGADVIVLQKILGVFKGPDTRAFEKFEAEMMEKCDEILEDLDNLNAAITTVTKQNEQLLLQLDMDNINSMAKEMDAFSSNYRLITEAYQKSVEAARVYVQNPTEENRQKLGNALQPIQEFYETAGTNSGDIQYNFTKDIMNYAANISPYQQSTTLQEKGEWVSRSFGQGDTTYIQALEKYYEDSTASQPEMYTALSCAMNYSVIPLYYYLLDRQLYTGMKVNEINLDTSLTRTEKDRRISNAWAEYDSDKNIALNAFIQMISDNYKTLTSYMRPYDTVPTEVTMDYAKTRELTVNRDLSNGKRSYTVTASDKTAETMGFSILKLRDGNVYAMLSDRGENQDFVLNDFISVVARSSFYNTTNVFASGDYHNLLKGSGSWSALKLIHRASEFENLTGYASYSLAENNLARYVTSVEGISGVFSAGISRDKFYGLTSNYSDNFSGAYSQDMSVVFYNLANLSDAGLDSSEEKLDLEDDIYDKGDSVKNQPVAVVMKKTEDEDIVLNMHIPAVKDCNVKLQYVDRLDENGNPMEIAAADQDGNYQVIAGERIEILVKPADGKKIASAVLQGQMMDGSFCDLESFVDPSDPNYSLNYRSTDAYGYLSLQTFPMPYRNTELNITTEEQQKEILYDASLLQPSENGELQFSGMPGVDTMTYHSGDKVSVLVWPEGRLIANGIKLTDAAGNQLDAVKITDETAASAMELPDGVKMFCFTMPQQNVKISADMSAEFIAYLGDVDDGKLVFTDATGNELENANSQKVYASGDRVYVKGVPRDDKSYFCESITVKYEGGSGVAVPVRIEENGISFIMPENDVRIVGTFKKRENYDVFARMNSENNATGMVQLSGNNSMQGNYKAGEKVTVTATPDQGCWMDSYTVTRKTNDGSAGQVIESTCVHRENSTAMDITFTMPAQNVEVNVIFDKYKVDTTDLCKGVLEIDNGLHGTIVEKNGTFDTELLTDISNGSNEFIACTAYAYELKVVKSDGQSDPKVTFVCDGQKSVTLSPKKEDGNTFTYTWDKNQMKGNFRVTVTADEKKDEIDETKYDYIIWNFKDMADCWGNMNRMANTEGVAFARIRFAADITVDEGYAVLPIPKFAGIIDGGGHKINGLNLAHWNLSGGQGLVCELNGQIKDLEISGVNAVAERTGVFAGTVNKGIIENCKLSGTVSSGTASAPSKEFGGIAHTVGSGSIIRNCGVTAEIVLNASGSDEAVVGGIAYSNQGSIENSYFTGNIRTLCGSIKRLAGICAGGDGTGKIWNCYTADLDQLSSSGKTEVYDIANNNTVSNVYISKETKEALEKAKQITYTSGTGVDYSYTIDDMTSSTFEDLLNKNVNGNSVYKEWIQTGLNRAYPFFERAYAITVKNELGTADITVIKKKGASEGYYSHGIPYGIYGDTMVICGTSTSEDVHVQVREKATGKVLTNTACKVSEQSFQTDFVMPDGEVEVIVTGEDLHYGKIIPVTAVSYPSNKADVTLIDRNGDYVDKAAMDEMLYVHVDNLAEGYDVSRLIFKNSLKTMPYKIIDDPQSVKQHDGSYGVILAGDPSLVQGKATIIVELAPKSHTVERVVTPENSGAIQCKNETARYGDTVSFTTQPANGYYLADVRICNKNGDVLDVPELKKGGGSFVMPDEDVVIKANFIPFTYSIQTKDSDHVKLLATDENGNHIASAQKGTQVALHYTKTPWTAYEQISVYRENEYNTPNAQPIATWTAKLPKDSEAQPMTFEMPGSGVIIESVMMDEGTYKISKDIEGNGSVYVKNLESGNVDSARQGEKIFVSASAQRGWSLDREQTVVADAQGQKLDVGAQDHGRYVSFAMPAQELNIKAVFTQNAYKVTVKGISEESISITDETGSAVDLNAVHYDDVLKIKADTAKIQTLHYYQTDVSNGAAVNIPLDENGEATLFMPDMNITIEEGSVMERDEDGTYLIRTFDDLNAVSKIVQSDKKANFKLMNNISGEGQKLLQTIGSASNPYEGTFDGQGYDIFNLSIENADGDTALFGTVGTNGIVKRVNVFYHHVTGKRAAGIAVINNGLIDECMSGANISGSINLKDHKDPVDLSKVNTFVTGSEMAGGVVAENHGKIRNTASYAQCTAKDPDGIAGGIAAVNDGVIENSFSRGKVFAGTTDTHAVRMARIAGAIAGGIAGQNTANGTIHNVYSVNDAVSATNAGAIFGENDGGSVSQTYFLNSLPGGAEQGTAMARTAMSDGTFADVLNSQVAAGTGWNTWYAQSNRNKGFPILYTSATVQNQVQDAARGITVTGRMHGATQLQVNTLDTDSYAYKAFAAYAASHNKKIALAADAALQLADGQAAPYQGSLNLQIDLAKYSGRNFRVLVYQNGAVRELTINGENLAAFEADELAPFAVLAENTDQSGNNGSDTSGNDGSGNTGNTASDPSAVKPNGGDNASLTDTKKLTSAKTGDNSHVVLWGIVLAAAAGAAVISIGYRRKKN